jgi:hypothetical protein
LKGSYYGTISDQISITCSGGESSTTKLRTILDYKDEVSHSLHPSLQVIGREAKELANRQSWLGRPKFALDGVIYRYTVGNEDEENWSRAKQVPSDKIVAHIEGSWMKQIKYRLKGEKVCSSSLLSSYMPAGNAEMG